MKAARRLFCVIDKLEPYEMNTQMGSLSTVINGFMFNPFVSRFPLVLAYIVLAHKAVYRVLDTCSFFFV